MLGLRLCMASILALLVIPTLVVGCFMGPPRVTHIVDGDTVDLNNGNRVRYLCIDTPERGEPFYEEASQRNAELVLRRRVRLEHGVEDFDRYGRLLRYVFVEDVFVNAVLVEEGYARTLIFDEEEPYADSLRELEAQAKAANLGLWGLD